jgi:hypothetical protein
VVGAVAAHLSLLLAREGVELANAASAALLGEQVNPANVTATIRTLALAPLQPGSLHGRSYDLWDAGDSSILLPRRPHTANAMFLKFVTPDGLSSPAPAAFGQSVR